ncbi:lysosomal-trafficking regulator mauve isoform X4 [Rhodnius prolixus]|uniref:lysosomal-trafficking regulator mauve isoform X4 n=1 Tax=Rhodnius prolixus TaxID=13249 RepID=UPI003D18C22A
MGDKTLLNIVSNKINFFWESFLKAESNTYERGSWLDLFLAEVLLQTQDGKTASEILSSTSHSVAGVLAEEIISDVKNICMLGTDEEDDFGPLRRHFLTGRGWRSLAVLYALPLQEVKCFGELTTLLTTVYGLEEDAASVGPHLHAVDNPYVQSKQAADIEQICRFRLSSRLKSRTFSLSSGVEGSSPGSSSRLISTSSHGKRQQIQQNTNCNSSDSEANEPHSICSLKQNSLKIRLDPMDFDYFTSVIRSEEDAGCCDGDGDGEKAGEKTSTSLSRSSNLPRKKGKRLSPVDFRDDRLTKVFKEEISGYQFRLLVVDLLQALCQTESAQSKVLLHCFNFSLDQLCSIQFSTIAGENKRVDDLKSSVTRLFLFALDRILVQPDSIGAVVQKGALPLMLRLLEDGVTKAARAREWRRMSYGNGTLLDFIFGVLYAVLNLVQCLLLQLHHHNDSADKVDSFLVHFRQFASSQNGRLVDRAITCILASSVHISSPDKSALNRVRKIINLLGQLVLSFKQIRTRLVHINSCKKSKHRNCRYPLLSHHHDDIFGRVSGNNMMPSTDIYDGTCAVTTLFMIFTRFLTEKTERDVAISIMQCMMQCGTCCCFPASLLVSKVLRVIQLTDTRVRNLGLSLLEKTIYREIGAIGLATFCKICVSGDEKQRTCGDLTRYRWTCLEAFQDMLLSPNSKVSQAVGSHLIRVAPRCSLQVQREMFFGVFYPVFITAKKKYLSGGTERDKQVIILCLSAFTNLLGRIRFAEEFLQRDGLQHILELIKDRHFTNLCCLILEVIVVLRVWKLEQKGVPQCLDENVVELKFLVDNIMDNSTEFLTTLKKFGCEKGEVVFHRISDWDVYFKCLERLGLFWRSWANLCIYSPQIRAYSNRHLSIQRYTLLTLFVQHLAKTVRIKVGTTDCNEKISVASQLNLKLLEPLIVLSVICPYSGNPGGVSQLKERLEKVVKGSLGLRSVCDVLLRASGAKPCQKTVVPMHPMPKLDDIETGLASAIDDNNSDSSLGNSADEGYDADIDLPCRKMQERNAISGKGSLPPSRRISCALNERKISQIVHPQLCHLALHLIVKSHKDEKWTKECVYSLHKLNAVLRDGPDNCICLAESGFLKNLLVQFTDLLTTGHPQNYEMQHAVLELFFCIGKSYIGADEMAIYISYFNSDSAPLKMLLPPLLKLANGIVPHQPKYILSFPVEYSNANLVNTTAAHKLAIGLHQQHISTNLQSCWSRGAIFLPLNAELGWAMWVQGFSFSLWLRLEPHHSLYMSDHADTYAESTSSESGRSSGLDDINIDHLLHIISIGYEAHVLEFWADTSKELLHVRLTRPDNQKIEVLSEVSLEGRLSTNIWHHLAISVHDSVHSGKVIIEVTLIMDGWCEVQVPLSFKGILVRKNRPTNVILGDTRKGVLKETENISVPPGQWHFGSLMMFRKPVLKENLMCSYSAKNSDAMNIYPQTPTTSGGLSASFRVVGMDQRCSQLVPMLVPLVTFSVLRSNCFSTICSSVDCLGGISVFVFLIARVVELGGNETEQAQALELLLRLSHAEPSLKAQSTSHLSLIKYMLETEACHPGPFMLKAILDTCCDRGGLLSTWTDELQVNASCDYILTDPFIIVTLVLRAPQAWLNAPGSPLALLLRSLLALLRDDHPFREFNAAQLNRANALEAILEFCKGRQIESSTKLDQQLCGALVDVIRGLMTAPPQLHHVTAVADYLLLAHPAHATYISHARTSIYFVLPPRPPSRQRRHARRNDSELFDRTDIGEYRGLFTRPVDPSKLNRALASLQIKQNLSNTRSRRRSKLSPSEEIINQSEIICDSGISGSYHGGNPELDLDRLSDTSANTYFTNRRLNRRSSSSSTTSSSSSSSTNATNDDEKYNNVSEIDEGEDSITIGLLNLLRDQILVMPDSVAHNALPNVLTPECFIVMANHANNAVTTAVVKVLSAYLERVSSEEKCRFVKDRGFQLLAMQLSHAVPTMELADALAGIVTNTHWLPISVQTGEDVDVLNLPGIAALLGLLPRSVSVASADLTLCHNIIAFLHNIFTKIADWKSFLEYGVVEALLKTLVCVVHQEGLANGEVTELTELDSNLLLTDVDSFLSTVVVQCLQTTGAANLIIFHDVLCQIEYVYGLECRSCGEIAECCLTVKRTHCNILQSALKSLVDTVSSHAPKPFFFSSVISISSDDVDSSSGYSVNTPTLTQTMMTAGKISKSDLIERFKAVATKSTEFLIYSEPNSYEIFANLENEKIIDYIKGVWAFLLQALVSIVERKSSSVRTSWSNVVWASREVLRGLGAQALLWLLTPANPLSLKMFAVQSILNEPRTKDILMYIISSTQMEKNLALFLWDLRNTGNMKESSLKSVNELISKFEEWCASSVLGLISSSVGLEPVNSGASFPTISREISVTETCAAYSLARYKWRRHRDQGPVHKVVYRHEPVVRELSERAMKVTKEVEAGQSHQRKLLMETIKNEFGCRVQAAFKWKELISSLTHERAVWHSPKFYPKSWELDPTEGPARVRNRLRRCHLNLDPKFFKTDSPANGHVINFDIESAEFSKGDKERLRFLFEGSMSTSAALIDRLHTNTKIRHMCKASVVSPDNTLPGELLIGHCSLYFVPTTSDNTKEWAFDQIKELHRRRFELQERALEIFLLNGKTFLIAFETTKERDVFMCALLDCELCNRVASEPLGEAVELWREGGLTNWHYLTILNTLAGRSYNDLMQYPVLPFILADYTSQVLDLDDIKSYRNLTKPMAIQEKKNEAHYINNYNYLKSELTDAMNIMSYNHEPYHYSSHYSNSGIVLHFLVRLPPFTNMFLSYQDNNFDWPDRTFHSLHTTWRLTSSESATDVKELIPEFFFLPEFLANRECFDFGTRQNGQPVDNVILPPWASDPRIFILIHRQALEARHVREYLPQWIDLVFGYKQTGKAAVESINVFHPATYYGFDADSIPDELLRTAWRTMVRMYGQTPRQLFKAPHPMVIKSLAPTTTISAPPVLKNVRGLTWGHYAGSPGDPPPTVIWQHNHHIPISTLVALLSNDVFGLAPNTCLLLTYSKESFISQTIAGHPSVLGAALISWGHGDGIVRAKLRKEQIPFPAISCNTDLVVFCTSVPDCNQLWMAYSSGKISVYSFKFDGLGGVLEFEEQPVCLVGHRTAVTSIAISRAFSVAVSAAGDGSAIMWDINTLTYVRSLPDIQLPLTVVNISETLGDIASVGQEGHSSSMRLHTINASLVGSLTTSEQITSVCFSTAPEGISVNVVAAGMSDGSIRLWSTWDLTPVGKISAHGLTQPIICVTFSHDSQHLYASTAEGQIVIWQASSVKSTGKTPRFLNLTSLL